MGKKQNKLTSVQKDLMIGLTSSLMFYIISELANLTEKLEDIIDWRILFIVKIVIAVWMRFWFIHQIRNKFNPPLILTLTLYRYTLFLLRELFLFQKTHTTLQKLNKSN